jgi:hypothetical protein
METIGVDEGDKWCKLFLQTLQQSLPDDQIKAINDARDVEVLALSLPTVPQGHPLWQVKAMISAAEDIFKQMATLDPSDDELKKKELQTCWATGGGGLFARVALLLIICCPLTSWCLRSWTPKAQVV